MEFAAIIIPTLNRIEHLSQCIQSLKSNSQAMDTDIYISVDYPPEERFFDGYEEVKAYVKEITGFKTVNIYYQETNLGPGLNIDFLMQRAREKHARNILTEDDNIFSHNYLEYMNWALDRYADDDTVFAVCSNSREIIIPNDYQANYVKTFTFNPYGSGFWFSKVDECKTFLQDEKIEGIYRSKKIRKKMYKLFPVEMWYLSGDLLREVPAMRGKKDNITFIDIWQGIYCAAMEKRCIVPTRDKAINIGNDGSGVNVGEDMTKQGCVDSLDDGEIWCPHSNPRGNEELLRIKHAELYGKVSLKKWIRMQLIFFCYNKLSKDKFAIFKSRMTRQKAASGNIYYG